MTRAQKGPSNKTLTGFFSAALLTSMMTTPDSLLGGNIDRLVNHFNDRHTPCVKMIYSLFEETELMENPFDRAALTVEIRIACALSG